jgi:hypothetical protein
MEFMDIDTPHPASSGMNVSQRSPNIHQQVGDWFAGGCQSGGRWIAGSATGMTSFTAIGGSSTSTCLTTAGGKTMARETERLWMKQLAPPRLAGQA